MAAATAAIDQQDGDRQYDHEKNYVGNIKLHRASSSVCLIRRDVGKFYEP